MSISLEEWAKTICRQTGFKREKEIHRGFYYSKNNIRSIIYEGRYQGKSVVLKVYNDPRPSDEPIALNTFNQQNKSGILKAPAIYKYKIISPHQGWFIAEKIPAKSHSFKRPVRPEQREEILEVYLEYRKNFPFEPQRQLTLSEELPADLFHIFRISRWLQLANNKEMTLDKPVLNHKEFIPRYKKAITLIKNRFQKRKMIWSHGHFGPDSLFKNLTNPKKPVYYLIDFMHTHMYPDGYELAFIIWSDWFVETDWKMSYSDWKQGVNDWLLKMKSITRKLKVGNFRSLIRDSLIERCIGTILADICATNRSREEKEKRIILIYQLLDELLSDKL
jgi:hypothetical protein